MDTQTLVEKQWPYLLSLLPAGIDLEASARQTGALLRKRGIPSAEVSAAARIHPPGGGNLIHFGGGDPIHSPPVLEALSRSGAEFGFVPVAARESGESTEGGA